MGSYEEIQRRAYQIWESNGCTHGHDAEDWTQAENEVGGEGKSKAKQKLAAKTSPPTAPTPKKTK